MAIEIVTENSTTHTKEILESNAVALVTRALEEYQCEAHEKALLANILNTFKIEE